ncbi:Minichromosome maintenance protein 10 [Candida viswanathii]|uniref:Minichromosome maintenance protein 10 n=1 Tax=Candida viswanathii TaxID=5486 RepID=A0A367YGH9_9ASCO|nr:Minichromosome maintenance protein 10 [Candida viswanathii]
MDDPRDEVVDSDSLLTEDSSDELKDLVKEFELKYEQLKKQKKLKKLAQKQQAERANRTEVPKTPEKTKTTTEKELTVDRWRPKDHHVPKAKEPSNFLNRLYETSSSTTPKIDYSQRKHDFELDKYEAKPVDVCDDLEPISKIYLRRRYLTPSQIRQITDEVDTNMKFLRIEKLLAKTNKSNNYAEPPYCNWCLVAFVLHKSPVQVASNNSKYTKLRVGSFVNSIEVMLFGEAFEKYFKIQPGDLVFMLNPFINKYEIQVTKGQYRTGFNLKIDNSNKSSILEVGAVRDFGICKYVKKQDNSRCSNVINIKNQELCDIHMDMKFKSSGRMELNGSVSIRSPKKGNNKMYMNNKGSGYIKQFNEDTNVIGLANTSPFDAKRYQDPKILQTQIKRRKLLDDKANESLEKKLKNLGSRTLLANLQLPEKHPHSNSKDTTKRVFTSAMVSQIGYDPTGLSTNTRSEPNKISQELRELSTLSSKSLTSSRADRQQKISKWKSNVLEQKKPQTVFVEKRRRVVHTPDDSEDSGDDDIDIKFGNPEERSKYSQMVAKR